MREDLEDDDGEEEPGEGMQELNVRKWLLWREYLDDPATRIVWTPEGTSLYIPPAMHHLVITVYSPVLQKVERVTLLLGATFVEPADLDGARRAFLLMGQVKSTDAYAGAGPKTDPRLKLESLQKLFDNWSLNRFTDAATLPDDPVRAEEMLRDILKLPKRIGDKRRKRSANQERAARAREGRVRAKAARDTAEENTDAGKKKRSKKGSDV